MKLSKLEKTFVNFTAKQRNIKTAERLFNYIDLDPEQIEKAKKYHRESEYLKFIKADATKLPFENKEFDLVLSFDALPKIITGWRFSVIFQKSSNGYHK